MNDAESPSDEQFIVEKVATVTDGIGTFSPEAVAASVPDEEINEKLTTAHEFATMFSDILNSGNTTENLPSLDAILSLSLEMRRKVLGMLAPLADFSMATWAVCFSTTC